MAAVKKPDPNMKGKIWVYILEMFVSDAYCESYLALSVTTLGTLSERFNSYFSKNIQYFLYDLVCTESNPLHFIFILWLYNNSPFLWHCNIAPKR